MLQQRLSAQSDSLNLLVASKNPLESSSASAVDSKFADEEKELLRKEHEAETEFLRKQASGSATAKDFDKLLEKLKDTQKQKMAVHEQK